MQVKPNCSNCRLYTEGKAIPYFSCMLDEQIIPNAEHMVCIAWEPGELVLKKFREKVYIVGITGFIVGIITFALLRIILQ